MTTLGERLTTLRKQKGFSQEQLAEESGVSLRSIQRLEKNSIKTPRGHTLGELAKVLNITVEELTKLPVLHTNATSVDFEALKKINLSAYLMLLIPFGNLFFPFMLFRRIKPELQTKKIALRILNFQLIWTILFSLALLASPLIQMLISQFQLSSRFPVTLSTFVVGYLINIATTTSVALSIKNEKETFLKKFPSIL